MVVSRDNCVYLIAFSEPGYIFIIEYLPGGGRVTEKKRKDYNRILYYLDGAILSFS